MKISSKDINKATNNNEKKLLCIILIEIAIITFSTLKIIGNSVYKFYGNLPQNKSKTNILSPRHHIGYYHYGLVLFMFSWYIFYFQCLYNDDDDDGVVSMTYSNFKITCTYFLMENISFNFRFIECFIFFCLLLQFFGWRKKNRIRFHSVNHTSKIAISRANSVRFFSVFVVLFHLPLLILPIRFGPNFSFFIIIRHCFRLYVSHSNRHIHTHIINS